MDPTPTQKRQQSDSDLLVVLSGAGGRGKASESDYRALLEDRPKKFTAEQVGYKPAGGESESCQHCAHFFRSQDRTVCEIFRPADDGDIEAEGYCRFQTPDGEEFPRLSARRP